MNGKINMSRDAFITRGVSSLFLVGNLSSVPEFWNLSSTVLVEKKQKISKKRLETEVKKKSGCFMFSAQTECMEEMLKM